ncbi:BglG family transcription antiterminator [Sediminibacillus halophilus]|uniref:Lichenan operon transcriptional antiterminator n=1 Tax=Sediminibacillus halophilus TaxID=482461 RepID=A0A1G9THF3_9BACI|nr:BglG family transcription antiterminator [Sediminibacillus halophilus]SDM46924.1 lichenan operon transcriptional antiterminator [Sediminibacillus halophilus]
MNSRTITILRELMAARSPLTSDYLASINQVTSRTTREDVKQLDVTLSHNGAVVESIRGTGYKLHIKDDQKFRKFLQEVLEEEAGEAPLVPDLPEERTAYLIRRLLLTDDYLKLDDLAEEMHISKSTIQNDLKNAKKILANYDIHLESRPNYGLRATGSELKLRFCMAEYIFDRSEEAGQSLLNAQLTSLAKEDLTVIWKIIMNQIKENGLTLSDIAINNLFIHLAIAYQRIKNGYHVSLYNKDMDDILDKKEYQVAKKIVGRVEESFQVAFPQTEVAYIAIHLLGTKMLYQTGMEIDQVMEDDIYQVVMSILERIEEKLALGIRQDQELIISLGLHLKPAINRYKYGMNIRNPMLEDIKTNYPLAFEAGLIAGLVLEEYTDAKIDENEIGYLALHIGAAIERQKLKTGPKRCLVVCASGMGSAQLLFYKLKSQFGEKLDVVGTTEYYRLNQASFKDIDFIVSSIPIPEQLPVPVIEVNTILGDADLKKIETYVADPKQSIADYFKQDLIFLQKDFASKQEVLEFLADTLTEKKLVDETFLAAVEEREAVAPTAFGNLVAVPHPITPQSNQTFLAFCTLKRAIDWSGKRVQFVCLLSVEKESTADLQSMYDLLGRVIDDPAIVQRLLKARDYEAFIDVLPK